MNQQLPSGTTLKSRGLLYLAGVAFNRVVPAWLVRCRAFGIYSLRVGEQFQATPGLTIKQCKTKDEFQVAAELTQAMDGNDMDRLEAWLCYLDDTPASGVWVSKRFFTEKELGVTIRLQDDQRWYFSAHTKKKYRGKGAYKNLIRSVLRTNVHDKALCAITNTNRASLVSHQRLIDQQIARCFVFRVFCVTFAVCKGLVETDRMVTLDSKSRPIEIRLQG